MSKNTHTFDQITFQHDDIYDTVPDGIPLRTRQCHFIENTTMELDVNGLCCVNVYGWLQLTVLLTRINKSQIN